MKFARGKWFAFLFALLSLSGLSTCGFWDVPIVESEITVAVNVSGLTPDITALYVTSTLNGTMAQQGQDITGRLDRFAIALPLTSTGHLDLQVVGRSAEKCVVASGTVGVDIGAPPPTRYEVTVTLAAAGSAEKSCTLTVSVSGKGTVTSTPAGITCTGTGDKVLTCSGDFPVGQQISLAASNDPKNYGIAYKGLCTSSPCSFTFSGPGEVDVGFAARVCSPSNWCFYAPLPQGNTLRAIWGVTANDIWAVGDAGTLLHYDGLTWTAPTPIGGATNADLYALHGTSSSDIWAVGSLGALIHYDGKTWSSSPDSGLRTGQLLHGVFAAATNNVWAVGYQGTLLHYDGSGWSIAAGSGSLTTTSLFTVWGGAANDIWAAGSGGTLLHYDGSAWSTSAQSGVLTTLPIYSIHGTAQNNVFALAYGDSLHYDGSMWSITSTNDGLSLSYGVWAAPGGNAWAVGYPVSGAGGGSSHLTAGSWQTSVPGTLDALYGVWASSETDVWAVGYYGALVHYDGQTWSPAPLAVPAKDYNSVQSIWGSGANDVWAVGTTGYLRHFDGTTWTTDPQSGVVTINPLYGVWGASPTSVLAVGGTGVWLRYNGTTWASIPYSGTVSSAYLYGVWGSGPTNAWAVGSSGALVSYNGTNVFTYAGTAPTTNYLRSVYYSNTYGYYAAGYSGALLRGLWSAMAENGTLTTQSLYGVFGATPPNFWAVGTTGTILRSPGGSTWVIDSASGTVTTNVLYHVWAASVPTVTAWAVGGIGTMVHYDGSAWSLAASATHSALYSVWGVNAGDIWAGGDGNILLRYQP